MREGKEYHTIPPPHLCTCINTHYSTDQHFLKRGVVALF